MIRYALKCTKGHEFESWFQSAASFDKLAKKGHVSCAVCGSGEVGKALMAPKVSAKVAKPDPSADRDVALARMRREVEQNATYVGGAFAKQARDMHNGDAPQTTIYGETSGAEARKLVEEGVPIVPLPFTPRRKMQ